MKKYFLLNTIILSVVFSGLHARSVSVSEAKQVAFNFFSLKSTSSVRGSVNPTLAYTRLEIDNTVDFYVFDMSPAKGFVIVAADDNVKPILGYSTESNFNGAFAHTGLRRWMNKTAANITLALQNNALADDRITGQWNSYRAGQNPVIEKRRTVSPLVTTAWDQESSTPPPYLYNLFCPWNSTDNQRCLTGCVATAAAQVMKYWNYPTAGMGSFSYNDATPNYSYNYGIQSTNFAAHTYQWSLMPSILTGNEPLAEDSAVDILMYDCAVAVGMDFGDDNQNGSGANSLLASELPSDSFCTQYALVKYFSYNPDTINGVFESNYNAQTWTALIEHELNIGRPVIYEGDDATQGGHAWVCDGYDADDNLHMNWGWSGFDNGYFAINNLTTSGNFNPIQTDDALIGILPKYPRAPITNFGATLTSSCTGTVQFNDFSQDVPTSWNWSFGDGGTSQLQNPVHAYSSSGTYTVTLTATNPAGSTPKTVTNYITVNLLTPPSVSNVSANSPQSFSLSATTSNTVAWYDAAGNLVSTSNPFVTPVISSNTTYYVQDSVLSPTAHVGPAAKGTGAYLPDPYALQFNVLSPCVIQSVYVYAQNASQRIIEVIDSTGHVVAQSNVYCPAGGSRAMVNLSVDAGGPYFMQTADTLGLFSDNAGAAYPYTDSLGLISITGNTAGSSTSYYYFYNWVVKSPDCVSPRVPVTVSVATGINEVSDAIGFYLFPNPANGYVTLQTSEAGNEFTWNVKNILGQSLINKTVQGGQTNVDISNFSTGVYLVELQTGGKSAVQKLLVTK